MTERDPDAAVERTLAGARRAEPSWTAGRQQQLKWSLMARLDEPRHPYALSVVLASVAVVIVVGGVAWHQLARRSVARLGPDAPFALDRMLPRLADGSSIVLDGPSAILKTLRESSDEVVVQLETGGAHFEVARRPSRIFRVQAGPVTVQVIGTRFHVRRDGARTRVSVDRGRVLASWWGGSRELGPGEQGMFPPEGVAPQAPAGEVVEALAARATAEDEDTQEARQGRAPSPAPPPAAPAVVTRRASPSSASPHVAAPATPAVLFALADRARAAGRPDAAVVHLREIVDRYPRDPHAPMAAFTEGRLLLEALAHPRQAAAAFERARALANGGPLAEDALAREVEALHAAGDTVAAHDRAVRYRELYPRGPRLGTVTRFGGLQAAP
jgi:TolA-binding protein